MKDEPRPFQLRHALQCNPTIGPSLVQHWAKQGYLMHGTVRKGSVERLTFSFNEMVYLGVIVRLSWYGVLSRETRVQVPENDYKNRFISLMEPQPLYNMICRIYKWQALLSVRPSLSELETPTARSKRSGLVYLIEYHNLLSLPLEIKLAQQDDAALWINCAKIKDDVSRSLLGVA